MTTEEQIRQIVEQMRIARFKQRMSQAELGRLIGVSGEAVCKWETGKQIPAIKNLFEACKALKMPLPLSGEK